MQAELQAGPADKPLTDKRVRDRLETIGEMQALGFRFYRNTLRREHPEASDARIDAMMDRWLGGELQPRDLGPDMLPAEPQRLRDG